MSASKTNFNLRKFINIPQFITTNNIPQFIMTKLEKNLHLNENHPIAIVKDLIYDYFDNSTTVNRKFDKFENLDPVVSTENNFDSLLIPSDHPARSKSDTYYVDEKHV